MKRKDAKKLLAFSLAGAIALGGMYIPSTNVQAADTTLTDGLTAWYNFDGDSLNMESKTVTNQATGEGKLADGKLGSAGTSLGVSSGTGISGSGLHFTQESASYMDIENAINTSEAYTVSLWVKIAEDNEPTNQTSIVQQTGNGRTVLFVRGKKLGGYTSAEHTTVPETAVPFGEWLHLVVSGSSHAENAAKNKFSIWMNGERLVNDDLSYSGMIKAVTTLRFGCHKQDNQVMKGDMDSIRIYNKEADDALVAALYAEHNASETGKYTVTVNDAIGGKVTTLDGTVFKGKNVAYGETVSLKAVPDADYDFSYWLDVDTNKVIQNNGDLNLLVLKTRTLTPVFTKKESTNFAVTFRMPKMFVNKLIDKKEADANNMVTLPTTLDLPDGYQLIGWKDLSNGTSYEFSKGTTEASVDSNTTFEAILSATAVGSITEGVMVGKYMCYIENGEAYDQDGSSAGAYCYRVANALMTIKATPVEGKNFSHWEATTVTRDGRKITVSTNSEFKWVMKSTVYLTAVFVDSNVEAATKPTVDIGFNSRTAFESNGVTKNRLRLQVVYDGVNGVKIVEKGLLVSLEDTTTEEMLVIDKEGTSTEGVKRFYSNGTEQTGSYIVNATLGANSVNKTVKYRGYVIYEDANGDLQEAYTEMMTSAPLTAAN